MLKRYFIKLSFNGKNYKGWQLQLNQPSVQDKLDKALSIIFKQQVKTTGAGRTDTGVHASEFYAHFDILYEPKEINLNEIIYKLNGILPHDIMIFNLFKVKNNAHARYDALSRTYNYYISKVKTPFNKDFVYYLHKYLDVKIMNEATKILMEYNDFTCFAKLHGNSKTNFCKIFYATWSETEEKLIFTITANRFLRNMVRSIVGTMIDIGSCKIDLEEFKRIIEAKNRSLAGYSVPPQGLFLTKITYHDEIFDVC